MAQRGEMAVVELVEDDGASDHAAPVDKDEVDRARGAVLERARGVLGWIRRHRVVSLTTVVVIVAAIVVPTALSVRTQQARAEALAALDDVLAPMPSAPEVMWTSAASPTSYTLTLGGLAWLRDDVVIMREQTGDSANSLRAIDARTGDELWTSALSSVPDLGQLDDRATDDPTTCTAPDADPGEGVVVCVLADSWQVTGPDGGVTHQLVEAASVSLRAFDVTTGETVLDRPLGKRASVAAVGADVVVAAAPGPGEGPATLVRLDPATGDERWSAEVPRPVDGAGWPNPTVQLLGDEIGVGWLGSTALYTGDGVAAGRLDSDTVLPVRGHRMAPVGMDSFTQLRDLDTGRVLDLGGAGPAWLTTDDGTVPDVLLLQSDDRLVGRNIVTGQRAWQVDWPMSSTLNLVIVDGMLARQTDNGLTVIDLATGTRLWHRTMSPSGQSIVTDGRRLLVLEWVVGSGLVVSAYDVRDGRRVWKAPVPVAVQDLAVVDHRLFAVGGEGVVAFGPG